MVASATDCSTLSYYRSTAKAESATKMSPKQCRYRSLASLKKHFESRVGAKNVSKAVSVQIFGQPKEANEVRGAMRCGAMWCDVVRCGGGKCGMI